MQADTYADEREDVLPDFGPTPEAAPRTDSARFQAFSQKIGKDLLFHVIPLHSTEKGARIARFYRPDEAKPGRPRSEEGRGALRRHPSPRTSCCRYIRSSAFEDQPLAAD